MSGQSSRFTSMAAASILLFARATMAYTDAELANGDVIVIEDFVSNPRMTWSTLNDPVMGGKSTAEFAIEGGLGSLNGEVVNVPSLSAPGFVTMQAKDDSFPDVSGCEGIEIYGKAKTPYDGYRISFGNDRADTMKYGSGYKAPFKIGSDFDNVRISFADFSDNWNEATGEIVEKCQKEDTKFCPTIETLQNFGSIAIWGEGVNGVIDIQVKTISAYDCKTDNDGDLFKTLLDIIGNTKGAGVTEGAGATDSKASTSNSGDSEEASEQAILSGQIAVPLSILALLGSLCSLVFVLRMKMNEKAPVPILKADPGDQIL